MDCIAGQATRTNPTVTVRRIEHLRPDPAERGVVRERPDRAAQVLDECPEIQAEDFPG